MEVRYFLIFVFSILYFNGICQLKLDFETPFPGVHKWEGHIDHFKINSEGQLQLNAPIAGESYIFTKYKTPLDSIQIDLYFKLQFAPSNDNFGKIYLFMDKATEIGASGYYLRIGENGTNDAIQLWKLIDGNNILMGSGRMGAVSTDPADARLKIKIYRNGLITMDSDYDGKSLFEEDLEIFDPSLVLSDSMYFGIYCKYTASRIDKFFYDDISIKTLEKDVIAPTLNKVEVINENMLLLSFSEPLDESSVAPIQQYSVSPDLGNPDQVVFSKSIPHQVILKYNAKKIISGIFYTINVTGIKDKSNNTKALSSSFAYAVKPEKGDLIISEILVDPYTGGEDFVEIYNNSSKFLKLDSLIFRNAQRNENKVLRTEIILQQAKYAAISANISFLKTTYQPPDTALLINGTLPAYNIESGNVSILSQNIRGIMVTLDSFEYNQKMHFSLLNVKKGVSLERISLSSPTNEPNNWHSASTLSKFATPGYRNSNFVAQQGHTIDAISISPDKKVFSPDGDGVDDFVLLQYKTDQTGYLATIRLFDAEGFPVADLANNYLLGSEGFIKWDGVDGEGNIVKLGMYIIQTKIFHPNGDVKMFRSVVVAAENF